MATVIVLPPMVAAQEQGWHGLLDISQILTKFEGEFYRHTLMSEPYSPARAEIEDVDLPRIFLAGVGPVMSRVAGEVADGLICSAFTTARYLREVTAPAVERGLAKVGRDRAAFQVMLPLFVATGQTEEQFESAVREARSLVAFYGSTPAYRGVLELHGWGDLQDELVLLSKQARYEEMTSLVDDDVLNTFAVVTEPAKLGAEVWHRYGAVAQRALFFFTSPHLDHPEHWEQILADLQGAA